MYTHSQKFSLNHEGTNKGYMYTTNIDLNESNLVGKWVKLAKDGHYHKQALKHLPMKDQVLVLVTKNVTNIPH